jgi:PAS domain-containing protein
MPIKNKRIMDKMGWIDRPILFVMTMAIFGGLFVATIGYFQQRFVIGVNLIQIQNLITPFLLGGLLAATIAYFFRLSRVQLLEQLKTERISTEFHKDAQGELEVSLQAIIETVLDGIITIDEVGTILTFNPAAENIFWYPSEEVIGQNIRILMPEPYKSEHDGYLKAFRDTGKKMSSAKVGKLKDCVKMAQNFRWCWQSVKCVMLISVCSLALCATSPTENRRKD